VAAELAWLFSMMSESRMHVVAPDRFVARLLAGTNLRPGVQVGVIMCVGTVMMMMCACVQHDVTEIKDVLLSHLEELVPSMRQMFYGRLNYRPVCACVLMLIVTCVVRVCVVDVDRDMCVRAL
jgi:hypothetical protein